ncbi:UdgX family uracil-DNA binding protein [Planosporangium flavigriseum]|uniref:Type-4 uracil-DNA glycosylase n=1 Tax=Planosporangium flavigriseum TaxID=373681 RepID=A0A8J3PLI9_9ACTN|nr:UdgX family uracil-DNA binding protein [Planosporangium flavigriseum]NJC64022.1 UdgX family uracil-DNA binding protein [Planosporangium flavigriseum]GIG72903.1 uracil-DNA glycosylase [Planosporangium flavigriseum]
MPDRGDYPGAEAFVPPDATSREDLAEAARGCHGCDLYEQATQTVFGRGPTPARIMLVGEQPGDVEDKRGEPFVGPAGRLLDRALAEAGIDPASAYRTNAVKHFRWKPAPRGGTRRIGVTPDVRHINACRPWLIAELKVVKPDVIVTLGAIAGRSLLGPSFRATKARGTLIEYRPPDIPGMTALLVPTIHPSAVLRSPDRDAAYAGFVDDLRVAARVLASPDAAKPSP